jgi:toxin YoeB
LKLVFSEQAWSDYLFWQSTDTAILGRVNQLIKDVSRSPFSGIGRPEPLVGNFKGFWSRRITQEHRLVYRLVGAGDGQSLEIAACRFHYSK